MKTSLQEGDPKEGSNNLLLYTHSRHRRRIHTPTMKERNPGFMESVLPTKEMPISNPELSALREEDVSPMLDANPQDGPQRSTFGTGLVQGRNTPYAWRNAYHKQKLAPLSLDPPPVILNSFGTFSAWNQYSTDSKDSKHRSYLDINLNKY
ncbi:hypothetical protein OSTOST_07118 [Ostertagia ostertagi]